MAVNRHTLRLTNQLRDQLSTIIDVQTRTLVKAWVSAWDDVATDLNDALLDLTTAAEGGKVTRAMMLRSQRLQNALQAITTSLGQLSTDVGITITDDLRDVINEAGRAQEAIIASQLPENERVPLQGWDRVDARQIDAIVKRSTQQITSRLKPLSRSADQAVRRELVRGVASGANPRVTARRMVDRAEGAFNGGLARAMTIARTETVDAHRAAAQVAQKQNRKVLQAWVWTTNLDSRTCPACWSMNGREFTVDEPGPQGHQNCRCTRVPKTVSWRDLGIDMDEPASLLPDAEAKFKDLSVAEQRAILGPTRYDAWARGDYPMSQWATKRSTDGWRDSFVPSKPGGPFSPAGLKPIKSPAPALSKIPRPSGPVLKPNLKLLTDDEHEALDWYTAAGFVKVNKALRGQTRMTKQTASMIDLIRSGLSKYDLPQLRVTRGTSLEELGVSTYEELEELVDQVTTQLGFMSTSARATPPFAASKNPLYLDLIVPEGTHGLYLAGLSMVPAEQEILLIDGRRILILGVTFDVRSNKWRVIGQILGG